MFTVTQTVLCLANEKVELQHNSELNEGVGVTSSVNPFPFKQFKKFGDFCGIPIRVSVIES